MERATNVFRPLPPRQVSLGSRVPDAQAAIGIDGFLESVGYRAGEFECLVEPPFPQTSAVQGKGDNQIGAAVGRRLRQNASEERSE